LSICSLRCLNVYKVADFTHADAHRIRYVCKNDDLLVLNIEIGFRTVYVRFTKGGSFGPRCGDFLLTALAASRPLQ
jgi:hypothetical protein